MHCTVLKLGVSIIATQNDIKSTREDFGLMFDFETAYRSNAFKSPNCVKSLIWNLGAFTCDVRCFLTFFDLPTYPNQILYYISLFSKIRCALTYLRT